ncbi:kynureninase [uncultured Microscilla sp.]|uniref:kynureninase n=1 Tax=uncultured Microscilla sp. TaxID=432653 RepID=UPI00261F8F1B|nr:kynureninase [uncultured Microscilla sp.]
MEYKNTADFARQQDQQDPLRKFRDQFHLPAKLHQDVIYFCGNSLGLQPKNLRAQVEKELQKWQDLAVEGHFLGDHPWMDYHKALKQPMTDIFGAKPNELTVMNSLTVNLHLLMATFYRPTATRYKIVMEAGAFPSDQYAMESQAKIHGFAYDDAVVEVSPRKGEHTLRTEDIVQTIENLGESVALVMFSGVNYYTGQVFDMDTITKAGHKVGAYVGFDLAHAAGNVALHLHDWNIDFAVWCTYKYLNSSPGGISGVFIHEKNATDTSLPRLAGWWGHNEDERFLMKKGFEAMPNVDGWQLSNAQVLLQAAHLASLQLFAQAGMPQLTAKSKKLTGYLEFVIREVCQNSHYPIEIITPTEARGCQLSLLVPQEGKKLFDYLHTHGVVGDWREPNSIRIAPVPLYNSFEDVYRFGQILKNGIQQG